MQNEKALNWLNKAVEQDPDNAATHCNLGNTFRSLGESRKAAAAYKHAIELNPRQGSYLLNLGGVLIELEELDEAVDCFNQVLVLNPEDQRAYLGLGKARNAQVVRPIYQDSVKLWTRYENYLEPLISTLNG